MRVRIKRCIIIVTTMIMTVSLFSCNTENNTKSSNDVIEENITEDTKEIEIWSHFSIKERIDSFNKAYPDIKVTEKIINYNDYVEEYLNALVSGDVPDVMIIDSSDFGNFNTVHGLENLDNERYNWNEYKNDFDKELIEVGKSLLDDSQLGIAYATAPYVTYYREDIMREYGFPSEPEELAKFMENEENYIAMAEELKKDDIYINQWPSDIIEVFYSASPYFDKDLNYLRDTEELERAINISNKMRSKNLISYKGIWKDEGLKNIKEGKQAMLFLGSWGGDQISQWVPEQEGKWRVTRLPFNIYGWNNSTILTIPKESKNKDSAWKFIEFLSFKDDYDGWGASVPGYLPLRKNPTAMSKENPFFNNQKDKAFYEEVIEKTEEYQPTPLDKKTMDIWVDLLNKCYEQEIDVETTRKMIKDTVEKELSDEIEIIKNNKK